MATARIDIHADMLDWRQRLEGAISDFDQSPHLVHLLHELNSALERMDQGTYGICRICDGPMNKDIVVDPLGRYCLDCLTSAETRALQQDLDSVSEIQGEMLPKRDFCFNGWEACYHYEAFGPVSGDYCDLLSADNGDLFFLFGDVAGKGIAASMLMAHLSATFRSLITVNLPLNQLVARANKVFSESTMPAYFATLVCGRAKNSGEVELCNAGHLPPLLIRGGGVTTIEATGLPLGLFNREQYSVANLKLEKDDCLLLYTDGVTEARDPLDGEYGTERLLRLAASYQHLAPQKLVEACLEDVRSFRSGAPRNDDLTVMAIRRSD
ncbi:MAG TPA: SpoIIE family protein phosphatase [Blastocatellia bacterium]|nr:SpoIIE family protein phosphatase [Blastocatellia bacterium]